MKSLDAFKGWLQGSHKPDRESVPPPEPSLFGSVIYANGQPGTGKTYLLSRLSLKAAYDHELPIIVQDTRGDVKIYIHEMARTLRDKGTKEGKARAGFLENTNKVRVISERETDYFLGIVEFYQKKALKAKVRKAELYCFIDEAGVIRRDSEDFWSIAAGFRNAGITCYTSGHKDTDVTRVGRQCLRAVILQRPYESEVEFFGVEIGAMQCSPPMSPIVTYIDSFERTVKTWNTKTEWNDPPEVLVAPVQPTNVKSMEF